MEQECQDMVHDDVMVRFTLNCPHFKNDCFSLYIANYKVFTDTNRITTGWTGTLGSHECVDGVVHCDGGCCSWGCGPDSDWLRSGSRSWRGGGCRCGCYWKWSTKNQKRMVKVDGNQIPKTDSVVRMMDTKIIQKQSSNDPCRNLNWQFDRLTDIS